MPHNIRCRIHECHHNDGRDRCMADDIEVRPRSAQIRCHHSEHTCCETFRPKEDGVVY